MVGEHTAQFLALFGREDGLQLPDEIQHPLLLERGQRAKLLDNFFLPDARRNKQLEDLRPVCDSLVFNGPPEQQRNMLILGIFIVLKQFPHHGKCRIDGKTLGGAGKLPAHNRA